jgi:hypothetical protein
MFQHDVDMFGFFNNVVVLDLSTLFGKSFTSCPGVGSSILSEKQNFVGHSSLLGWPGVAGRTLMVELAIRCTASSL